MSEAVEYDPMKVKPLKRFNAAAFRAALVGLSAPEKKLDAMSRESLKKEAIEFAATLPELYGYDDRLQLWEFIAKSLTRACDAVSDGDMAAWSNIVLEGIACEKWRAAVHDGWCQYQQLFEARPAEWREQFIRYIGNGLGTVLPLARARWEEKKKMRTVKGGAV